MKRIAAHISSLLLAMTAVVMLGGCVKNEFSIRMEFPSDYIGNYIISYYAWDSKKGAWLEETLPVQSGKAEAGCITRRPTLVFIADASNPRNSIALYAERGDKILISGSSSDMMQWKITGNKISSEWGAWRNSLPKNPTAADINKSVASFVRNHPDSKVSALLLLEEYDRRENPAEFAKLWNAIDPKAKPADLMEMCGAADLSEAIFSTDGKGKLRPSAVSKLASLRLRTLDNGLDTLKLSKLPSFIYFYKDNGINRTATLDTLKALAKAFPDSAKRIMCDISVDSDSITWVNSIRYDSLKTVVRGWIPGGLADESMISTGAVRLPWYRVAAKGGKVVYEGSDLEKADSLFRKELKKEKKATSKAGK